MDSSNKLLEIKNKCLASVEKFVRFIKHDIKKKKWYIAGVGAIALIWFIIRVIPKPQRATYPCQQAAFPIASAFVIWISGTIASKTLFKRAKLAFVHQQHTRSILLGGVAITIFMASVFFSQIYETTAIGISTRKLEQSGESLYLRQQSAVETDTVTPEAFVGIVQSEEANAEDIDFEELNTMVRSAVQLAGGFDTLIQEGDTVVLKPNVISSRTEGGVLFPQTANGIATDYRIIQIVANMVREYNTSGKIFIIEASGNGVTRSNIEELGYYNVTGIDSIILLDEFEGAWYDATAADLVEVNLPEGKNLYNSLNKYYLNTIYKKAQVLISLPCLKTHMLTGITGSVKNVGIGATPVRMYGNGPGFDDIVKAARWNIINHGDFYSTSAPLDNWIHDFYMCRPVDYTITDGLQGAEFGPYPGGAGNVNITLSSVQKNKRLILAGKDAVATDAVHALIVGANPYNIGHLQFLAKDDIGCINPSLIRVNGKPIHEIKEAFSEIRPGNLKMYNDFDAPWVNLPTPGTISDGLLNLDLEPDNSVVKIEIAYNDTILSPIIVDNFENINIPLKNWQTDISKVRVLAYDRYLNCLEFIPDHVITSTTETAIKPLKLYPIPANEYITVDCRDIPADYLQYQVLSLDGKLMLTDKLNIGTLHSLNINISNLPAGNYIFNTVSDNNKLSAQFVKSKQ